MTSKPRSTVSTTPTPAPSGSTAITPHPPGLCRAAGDPAIFGGTSLVYLVQVPAVVLQTLARQLGLVPEQLAPYRGPPQYRLRAHQPLIQDYLQYHSFDGRQAFRLTRWLYAQVATSTVRPSGLFDLATAHLVAQHVVLPGAWC